MTEDIQAPAAAPDWAAIRARYEAGAEKVAEIAASLGWAGIKLSRFAKAQGWALRGAGAPATSPRQQAETTTKTLQRLKELLQKRLHHLEQALGQISADVEGQSNERDIRSTNTLVRTLEKVLELEDRERKSRSKRARDANRLNDAERDELARRIAGLCADGQGGDAQPQPEHQRGAETPVGVGDLGAGRPASAAG